MRTKTFIELLTLSSNLYLIAKDTKALEKLHEFTEMSKEKLNDFAKEKMVDSEGNELEFVEKIAHKLHDAKEELEAKISEVVESMYEKMRIAHTNQVNDLEDKIQALTKELSLAKSRIEVLENAES